MATYIYIQKALRIHSAGSLNKKTSDTDFTLYKGYNANNSVNYMQYLAAILQTIKLSSNKTKCGSTSV